MALVEALLEAPSSWPTSPSLCSVVEQKACRANVAFGALYAVGKHISCQQAHLTVFIAIADLHLFRNNSHYFRTQVKPAFGTSIRIARLAWLETGVKRWMFVADLIFRRESFRRA